MTTAIRFEESVAGTGGIFCGAAMSTNLDRSPTSCLYQAGRANLAGQPDGTGYGEGEPDLAGAGYGEGDLDGAGYGEP